MFGPGLVSADVGFSVWRYLAVAGLLVSWISSLVLLRKGSDGMPELRFLAQQKYAESD